MRTLLAAIVLMVVSFFGAATLASAQERNVQGYIGAQYVRVNPEQNRSFRFNNSTDSFGVNGSVTGFPVSDGPIGLTGELAANFSSNDTSLVTAMGGVTLQARNEKYQPFARGLVGVGRLRATNKLFTNIFDTTDTGLAYAFGGGLDVKVSRNVAIRVIQADYLRTNNFGTSTNNLRLGAGIRF